MFSPSSVRTDSFLDASLGLLSTPAKLLLRTLKLKGSSSSIELAPFITKCMAGNPLLLSVVEARQPEKSEQHRPHGSPSLSSSSYLCVTGPTRSHIAQRVLNIEQLIYPRGVFFFFKMVWFQLQMINGDKNRVPVTSPFPGVLQASYQGISPMHPVAVCCSVCSFSCLVSKFTLLLQSISSTLTASGKSPPCMASLVIWLLKYLSPSPLYPCH